MEEPDRGAMAEVLIAAANDGLVAIDTDGHVVMMNPAAGRIFGVDPEAMLGQSLESLMVPGMFVEHQQFVRDHFGGKGRGVVGNTPVEATGWHSAGRNLPLEISLSEVTVSEQRLILASIRDISQRKASDQQNRELLEQLTQAQKMNALGNLAAGIAHDFNNMLGAITGFACAMQAELDEKHPHRQDVEKILAVARKAKTLTEGLLAVSHRADFSADVISLGQVVGVVVELLRRTLPRQIVIKTKLARGMNVEGDHLQLEQALINLCLNARDALPDGGEIHLRTHRIDLDEASAGVLRVRPGAYCRLTVRDNGLGMSTETLARVFEPFFSTKPPEEGSGLGLAIVAATIKRHHGAVRLESEPGRGTSVHLYVPLSADAPREEAPGAPISPAEPGTAANGETLLIVDDEKLLLEMARRLLEGKGYRILLAESGEQALEIFRKHHQVIQLVILDVMLVGMTSEETLAALRNIDGNVRVLLSSGLIERGASRRLMSAGVAGFVQKPYGIVEIEAAIRQALAAP